MRISYLLLIGALFFSTASAKIENPNRLEDPTTQESVSTQNSNSSPVEALKNDEFQQPPDKPRNVRATEIISSPFFSEHSWPSVEAPIFFEAPLQDKEKSKMVLIEPFFRLKKEEKGFWGWLKKIFGDEKENKAQGPLIGPIKIPGMSDNVFIRAMDPENEADHVVIHLMMNNQPLGAPEKEIKLETPLHFVSFEHFHQSPVVDHLHQPPVVDHLQQSPVVNHLHQSPVEGSNFQTIVSPHFSHGGVYEKAHFPGADDSLSSPPSSVSFPAEREHSFANPTFFRKHSTESEGPELSGTLAKDPGNSQQYRAWVEPQQYSSSPESYEVKENQEHDFYEPADNRQLSSAREDIDNVQRTQTSQLELSGNKESLPLYPPLFNSSFGQIGQNNKEQIYVTNSREVDNSRTSSGSNKDPITYPGLGAYRSELKIITLPKRNKTYANLDNEFINNIGIQEVEAPNLSQAENRGTYKISEIVSEGKNNLKNLESSKRIRNSYSSDYGNFGTRDSEKSENVDQISQLNGTNEDLKTFSVSYPWQYRASKDKYDIPKREDRNSIKEEKVVVKEVLESSGSNSQVQGQPENRNSSLPKLKTSHALEEESRKNVRNDLRSRSRLRTRKQRTDTQKTENKKSASQTDKNSNLQTRGDSESNLLSLKNGTENKSIAEKNCSGLASSCLEERGKENEEKKLLTAEEVREFFLKESKRFEEVLKAVEDESKAVREEERKVLKEKSRNFEDVPNKDIKEEMKVVEEESRVGGKERKYLEKSDESKADKKAIEKSKATKKEIKELEDSKANKQEVKETEQSRIGKKETKESKESKELEEESKAIKEELKAVKDDLKAFKEELKVTKEKSKVVKESKSTEEKLKDVKEEPKKEVLNAKESKSEEKTTSEVNNVTTEPAESENLNYKAQIVTPESRIRSKLDSQSRKSSREEFRKSNREEVKKNNRAEVTKPNREEVKISIREEVNKFYSEAGKDSNKEEVKNSSSVEVKKSIREEKGKTNRGEKRKTNREEVKKSNSTAKFELKKPVIQSSKASSKEGRYKNKVHNNTNSIKSSSEIKTETPKTTPPTHISKIYTRNRPIKKLKINAKKYKSLESEESGKEEEKTKSLETEAKVEKPKTERVRIKKFSPRNRNIKSKVDLKMSVASDEDFE